MSASTSPAPVRSPAQARAHAHELIRDGHRMIADGHHLLSILGESESASGRTVPIRPEELFMSVEEAAKRLGVSVRTVERTARGKACFRRIGRRVLIEWHGLAALTRKG